MHFQNELKLVAKSKNISNFANTELLDESINRFLAFNFLQMEENNPKDHNNEIFSRAVKAGKRTYFFDVKATANEKLYITITESKRRFDPATSRYTFEKHKIFLYKEDFEKFANGLSDVIEFIETGHEPPLRDENLIEEHQENVQFEDLSFNS